MTRPITQDSFFNGQVRVKQTADGYRFSIDAVILAWHITPAPGARIVDLGTGCGIIPLILACRHPSVSITGIEIQPQLAQMATENAAVNRMADRVSIVCGDIRKAGDHLLAGKADIVACNPPFRKADAGRINPDEERAIARHELTVTLKDILAAAKRALRTAGEFAAIYPAFRAPDMICAMREAGIEPKLMRTIHSRQNEAARLTLVKGTRNGRPGAVIAPPLVIYAADDRYTPEVERMFLP
ncbi:MAG: tRNA1(Val) (adenine(37)-N6)-methyltransferase [Thermodesulfobacteriota bacterium]|nr:tRNA1(Val) (adenine(37)-N6)-methyltransferase [Thermodesulfobacteriota bacterium]